MHRPTRIRSIRRTLPRFVENLESRLLLSTTLTPAQIRQAYGISQLSATGAGQTIAIIDAYNDTHIASDLNAFDQNFSLSGSSTLYSQFGAASSFLTVDTLGTRTQSDTGWAMEEALDVEWAHAIAPGAKIIVVQAQSDSLTNLLAAVNYARDISTVSVISMSWGTSEFSGQTSYDADFTTPAGHIGITFVASAGDDGAGASWPAISDNVLAVGGTTLTLASNGNYGSESAWSDSGGGGSSLYEATPSYQSSVNSTSHRTDPDVAYDADPNSGYYVYDSNYYGQSGLWSVGGTSAGAPQWAALIALADQMRGTSLTTTQTLTTLYQLPASDFHDITTGSNGNAAKTGYDLVTGRGSPVANLLVPALAAGGSVGTGTTKTQSASSSNSNSRLPGWHFFQVENFLSPLPPVASLSTDFASLPTLAIIPADTGFITAPLMLSSTSSFVAATPFLSEARIADQLLPPSTDQILPSAEPDPTLQDFAAPADSPAPAPFAQLPDDSNLELAFGPVDDFMA